MALMEYFRYDGIEIFNSLRVGAYAKTMKLGFFKCDEACSSLQLFLEDQGWKEKHQPYTVPDAIHNRAPWYDDAVPISYEFAGAHLLDVSNIGSSTRTGSSSEYIGDGGWVQGSRRSSREMVFRALLIGSTLEGARYGLSWLSTVLDGGDVCRKAKRVRNTYSDISFGWILYKRAQAELIPDNVFQANPLHGCATGLLPTQGNTYANLRNCTTPKAFPLENPSEDIYATRAGLGFGLDFLIDCPIKHHYSDTMRHIEDVSVLSGPTILSERVIGGDCQDGAWVEVEFTLLGGNPGVWWNPKNVLTTPASGMRYADFLPCRRPGVYDDVLAEWSIYEAQGAPVTGENVFEANQFNGVATGSTAELGNTYDNLEFATLPRVMVDAQCMGTWIMYKGGQPLPVDDDVFNGPLKWNRPQTYGGLLAALWDQLSFLGQTGPLLADKQSFPVVSERTSGQSILIDPSCPVPAGFPGAPSDDVFCPPPWTGEVNRFRYEVDVPAIPRFLPTAVTTTLYAPLELRNVVMTFIPQLGQADPSKILAFRVSWIPADSLVLIDGVNRRADVLTNYTKPEGQQKWMRADHLIFRTDSSFAYSYPEVVCGARSIIYFDIPDIYDPLAPNFGLWTTSRDV